MTSHNPSQSPCPSADPEPLVKRRVRVSNKKPKDAPDDVGVASATTRAERKARDEAEGNVVKITESKVVSLDAPTEWVDVPTMVNQIEHEGAWRPKRREARVFNLSDADQLAKYNELLVLTGSPTTNCFIASETTQFDQSKGVWSALVKLMFVEYKRVFKKEKS